MSTAAADVALDQVAAAATALLTARERLQQVVQAAVAGGSSWRAVGQVLGVSAAVARREYGPAREPRPAPPARPRVLLVHGWVSLGPQRAAKAVRSALVPTPRRPDEGAAATPRSTTWSSTGSTTTARLLSETGRRVVRALRAAARAVAVVRAVMRR